MKATKLYASNWANTHALISPPLLKGGAVALSKTLQEIKLINKKNLYLVEKFLNVPLLLLSAKKQIYILAKITPPVNALPKIIILPITK